MSIISSIYKKNISGNTKKDVVIVVVFVLFILWSIINTSSSEEKQNDSVEITNNTEQSTESGKSIIGDLALVIEVIDGDTIKIEGGV
ncbi:hypothetical protein KJ782_05040, partial [Patescibacteria group bacterium]|nr:hypothetical protein [Patescibacteria group bacterium]